MLVQANICQHTPSTKGIAVHHLSGSYDTDYTRGLFDGLPEQDGQDHPLTERIGRHRKPMWLRERGCNK